LNKDLAEIQHGVRKLQRDYPYLLANSNLHISNTTCLEECVILQDCHIKKGAHLKNVKEFARNLDTLKVVVVRLIKQQMN